MNWGRLLDWLCESRVSSCKGRLEVQIGNSAYYQKLNKALQDTIDNLEVQIVALKKNGSNTATIVSELTSDIPTSRDKPSPKSSLTHKQAVELAKLVGVQAFQRTGIPTTYFTVQNTNSMEWLIDANTVVVAEKVLNNTSITVGDVVIYNGTGSKDQVNGSNVMHRVMKVDNEHERYLIKGDNNLNTDGWVSREYLLWKPFCYITSKKVQGQGSDD